MRVIAAAIRNPIAVGVTVLLVALFGTLSLLELPLQLFPDIERPTIGITTNWRGASPEEAEAELLEPQERVLQGLSGVEEITGNANSGGTDVTITFAIGTDMKAALVDVIGRMSRLPPLPRDADRPIVQLGGLGGDTNESLTWFFVQLLPGTPGPIDNYRRFIEDVVQPRLESIPGVGGIRVNGGAPNDIRITVDLPRAAALGVGIPDIARLAASANNVSAGQLDVGRRQYALRYAGRYDVDQLGQLVLAWRDGQPVRLSDVAVVEARPPDQLFYSHQNGNPAIGLQLLRAPGANVLSTLEEAKRVVAELREGPLRERGLGIEQSFDASVFITRAVNLLIENLVVGALLALVCVWWFMRNVRATVIIATTIPICLLATFCALHLAGRSINVISLAGLAFAVGMVVEGAIVVSGNIIRLRETGMPIDQAAHDGTRQVVPALFASTTTTIAVFLPVLFLKDVEGQIFADLALTISIAVAFSILVAITFVPAAAGRMLSGPAQKSGYGEGWPGLTDKVIEWTRTRRQQVMWVLVLLVAPLLLSWAFLPKLDYLPPVKRAAIDAYFSFPPGMSPATVDREIVTRLHERMQPYMTGEKEPRLKNYYVLLWPGGGTLGARVIDDERIGELERIVRDEIVVGIPDTRVFVNEGELFGGIGGSARSVAIHLQTTDTASLNSTAADGRRLLEETFPGANVQSFPNTDVQVLELRAEPNDRRIAEVGWDRAALGTVVRSLGDGAWLGEYFDGQTRLPVILRTNLGETPEDLAQAPLITPSGEVVPLGELVTLETTLVSEQIRRVDHHRTVTLTIDPPPTLSLEDMLAKINSDIVPQLRANLPADANIRLAGSADRLDTIIATMSGNFLLALLVLFMLMAAMFHSLRDALVVVLTVPLALAGGVLGIRLLGVVAFQPLDLLTMIGFIMMIGIIVNHAILLVDLTREAMNHGHSLEEALRMSLNQRLRAMVASTLTGALGALPMVVNPGPASTIYRGLAAVNVAGVIVSMVFSIVLLPSLMRLVYERRAPAAATHDAGLLTETAQ
ncbi:efflux RND transporter permease subunit [Peristeroidobacter agariperforans]|uniref:efflux RND transporter permease subunit n=1 Tax=Peristeroidobacter agariperforans TaxID=268404 RepID=UPI00101DF8AF|nr:efflux RND transporter permease subunit [Peristeroidobacter agariperforans]